MSLENLDNLVKIKQLNVEPPDQNEFDGMVASAKRRLPDAQVEGLSDEGRFSLAYGAAHAISVAALRWHGHNHGHPLIESDSSKRTQNEYYKYWWSRY